MRPWLRRRFSTGRALAGICVSKYDHRKVKRGAAMECMQSDRRSFLKGLAGAGALTLGWSPVFAQSGGKATFIEPFDPILEFMPELNAVAGGHFKAQGLDIEIVNARGTSLAVQQLIARQALFTRLGVLDLIKAHAQQQVPIISIATAYQSAIFNVVSLKSAPIKTPADMKGKTIGVASLGGGTENTLDLMLASAGIPKQDVPRQAVGLSPGSVELLKQGRVAAFFATIEVSIALQRANEPVEIWNVDRFAPIPGGAFVVTKELTEKEPETIVRFLRGIRASITELLTGDLNRILDRAEARFDITGNKARDFRIDALKAYNTLADSKGRDNVLQNIPAAWQASAALTQKAGVATVSNINDLYTNRFLQLAAKT
jgi:NitT/TauT family transport system substrate-binding protein